MKYTYAIETYYLDKWAVIVRDTRDFCLGYLSRARDYSPRNAYRLVRSDGRVMHESPAYADVSVGQIAGYPTPEQYEAAAKRALAQAAAIRERQAREESRRSALSNDRTLATQPAKTDSDSK